MREPLLRRALFTLALFAALIPSAVLAESIDSMSVTLDVHTDASVTVTEVINYNFADAQKHGIFRDIKESYQDQLGGTEQISITDVHVTDKNGQSYPFSQSESAGFLHIKIGDPQVLVSGKKTYVITYIAHDVIGFFSDHDEIYWNASGNGWQVPIIEIHVGVWTPVDSTSHACYVGAAGSTTSCTIDVRRDGTNKPIALFSTKNLLPGEGITVAVGLPKGIITEPTQARRVATLILHNGLVALPIPVFLLLFILWYRYGRDARGRGTIIPEYDAPESVTPFDAAQLVRQRIKPSDASAEIIRLAVLGYIHITRIDTKTLVIFSSTDYRIDKLKAAGTDLSAEETLLLNGLFQSTDTVLLSELKTSRALYSALKGIKTALAKRMVSDGYFKTNPLNIGILYIVLSVAFIAGAVYLFISGFSPLSALAVAVCGILVAAFGYIMPALTPKGALAREQILGLKDYLQIAEKNRLDFHSAPEKSPQLFEKLLPYAMVLGVSTAWAKEFEGIYKNPPSWYSGGIYPVFTPTAFASDMNSFSTAAAAIAAPTSGSGGSGGGGFSGGGFGGGGGGSW